MGRSTDSPRPEPAVKTDPALVLRLPASSRFESRLGSSEGVGCRRTLAVAVDRIVAVEGLFAAVAGAFFVAAVKMLEAAASSFTSSSFEVESWFSLEVGT